MEDLLPRSRIPRPMLPDVLARRGTASEEEAEAQDLKTAPSRPVAALAVGCCAVMLPGNLPHIGIVTDRKSVEGRPLIAHNIGRGPEVEDMLFAYPITGHYRYLKW